MPSKNRKMGKETHKQPLLDAGNRNRHALFLQFKSNPDYEDVSFNPTTGGLMATHKGHNFTKQGGKYEKVVQQVGFNAGNIVILGDERGFDTRHTEGTWNGMLFEVAGRETATSNNVLKGLKHCASKKTTEVAVLYFPNRFSLEILKNAMNRYKGLKKLNDGQFLQFKKIICIQAEVIVTEIDMV